MRKTGWVAAAGVGSLAMLLAACGGSSSSSSASGPTASTTAAAGEASAAALASLPPPGSVVMIVQKSAIGYVLAEANGQVVYTYGKDTKGGKPACTGSCAATWLPVTGAPVASTADKLPGTLGTVADDNGAKQVTYNGMPLYSFKGAKILTTKANGTDGEWHVVMLSASDIAS
jgi:predicted lipoprotein with Yx(FWY)xxD motif